MRAFFRTLWHLPRSSAILLIRGYQATLSPDHGPLRHLHPHGYCLHDPTCSMYAKNVLRERGFVVGTLLSIKRIVSCNPWNSPSDEKMTKLLTQR